MAQLVDDVSFCVRVNVRKGANIKKKIFDPCQGHTL